MKPLFSISSKDRIARWLPFRKLNAQSKRFLVDNFVYYQHLHERDKVLFEHRVQKFIEMKEFVARGELVVVTLEMKTLIAASAVQITFGLPSIYFRHFYKILVYANDYYSTITRQYHRGEVNTRGMIVLSWSHLWQGYLDMTDGRNLGLHEMAHALRVSDAYINEEQDFFDRSKLMKFVSLGRFEMEIIAAGEASFFREYAATNDQEFFAVAVENFFERPDLFKNYHPDLFYLLSSLLNQNPIRKTNPVGEDTFRRL